MVYRWMVALLALGLLLGLALYSLWHGLPALGGGDASLMPFDPTADTAWVLLIFAPALLCFLPFLEPRLQISPRGQPLPRSDRVGAALLLLLAWAVPLVSWVKDAHAEIWGGLAAIPTSGSLVLLAWSFVVAAGGLLVLDFHAQHYSGPLLRGHTLVGVLAAAIIVGLSLIGRIPTGPDSVTPLLGPRVLWPLAATTGALLVLDYYVQHHAGLAALLVRGRTRLVMLAPLAVVWLWANIGLDLHAYPTRWPWALAVTTAILVLDYRTRRHAGAPVRWRRYLGPLALLAILWLAVMLPQASISWTLNTECCCFTAPLDSPVQALATDRLGNLYVLDPMDLRVGGFYNDASYGAVRYNLAHWLVTAYYGQPLYTPPVPFTAMSLTADGRVIVGRTGGHWLYETAGAQPTSRFSSGVDWHAFARLPGHGLPPHAGLAVAQTNLIYYSDPAAGALYALTPTGALTSLPPSLNLPRWQPAGLALDDQGTLYVADAASRSILAVPPGGAWRSVARLGPPPSADNPLITLTRDASTGTLYAVDGTTVYAVLPTGQVAPLLSGGRLEAATGYGQRLYLSSSVPFRPLSYRDGAGPIVNPEGFGCG
jgi:hypothetical protein